MDSWYHARLEGWDYPITSVDNTLRDLIDLFIAANRDPKFPKSQPYNRPYKLTNPGTQTIKGDGSVYSDYSFKIGSKTPDEIKEANKIFIKQNGGSIGEILKSQSSPE